MDGPDVLAQRPCNGCLVQASTPSAWPHSALSRLHAPDGAGSAIYSCTLCHTSFVQEIALAPGSTQQRVFGMLVSTRPLAGRRPDRQG